MKIDSIDAYYQNVDNVDDARFLFKQMDHDGDGVLSQEELRRQGYSKGISEQNLLSLCAGRARGSRTRRLRLCSPWAMSTVTGSLTSTSSST